MAGEDLSTLTPDTDDAQLAQIRVPLEDAGAVFESRDANGRTPVVVVPLRNLRIRFDFLAVAVGLLAAGSLILLFGWSFVLALIAFVIAAVLAGLGLMSAFFVRVPEGTHALT